MHPQKEINTSFSLSLCLQIGVLQNRLASFRIGQDTAFHFANNRPVWLIDSREVANKSTTSPAVPSCANISFLLRRKLATSEPTHVSLLTFPRQPFSKCLLMRLF
ncbi:hypothetical protein CEXT_719461 [Caerostris extrusa]|uniref:Uncharacterized protein n=1 Tax=Caerostris extrusa TaxID=172846 RepID=A0AAV4U1G8_CAEEX|nr:hypothetical protein CEXT_719461 [Caerostris extrusa]